MLWEEGEKVYHFFTKIERSWEALAGERARRAILQSQAGMPVPLLRSGAIGLGEGGFPFGGERGRRSCRRIGREPIGMFLMETDEVLEARKKLGDRVGAAQSSGTAARQFAVAGLPSTT